MIKTSDRIMELTRVLAGGESIERALALAEFAQVAIANGWVENGVCGVDHPLYGTHAACGWADLAILVNRRLVLLTDPKDMLGNLERALDADDETKAAETEPEAKEATSFEDLARSAIFRAAEMIADNMPPPVELTYLYTARIPTIRLSDVSSIDTVITEMIVGVSVGTCESGASLECPRKNPNMGILRVLPESMLPGQERTTIFQCLPCYEASAAAYVRKLHRR